MGWVSYIEDNIEQLNERIRRDEADRETLKDAKAALSEVKQYLELATSPDVNLAHEVKTRDRQINHLNGDLKAKENEVRNLENESARRFAELQDAKRAIEKLRKKNRELEEKFNRVDRKVLYDVYSSPSMIRKHKSNR